MIVAKKIIHFLWEHNTILYNYILTKRPLCVSLNNILSMAHWEQEVFVHKLSIMILIGFFQYGPCTILVLLPFSLNNTP